MSDPTTYTKEISSLMHIAGDVKQPLKETAVFVEKALHSYLLNVISTSSTVAHLRGSKSISKSDVFFSLRKNPNTMQRIRNFLQIKSVQAMLNEPNSQYEEIELAEKAEPKVTLNDIRRMEQNLVTLNMSRTDYLMYFEVRQWSIVYKKTKKFREWLGVNGMRFPDSVSELLGICAVEFVYTLVEKGLMTMYFKRKYSSMRKFTILSIENEELPLDLDSVRIAYSELSNVYRIKRN